jgi:flagellar hook-basal body complex protein FliE
MDIKGINSQVAGAVGALGAGKTPAVSGKGGADFVASLDSALNAVSRNQQGAAELQRQFQLENPNVSLEETMIAMNKSTLSFQAAVQVRNKLVQAYEQIMNMPV